MVEGLEETTGVWVEVVGITMFFWVWVWEADEWFCDEELISLPNSEDVFFVLTLIGKGNYFGGITSFSLCDLVRGLEEKNCEVTLPSDNSDSSNDNDNPCNL